MSFLPFFVVRMDKKISLVYMVAGMSSRFGGRIKQFANVGPNNSSLIEYSLQQALPAGFAKIIFIVGKMTEQPFKEKFWTMYKWIPVEYAIQNFDESLRDRPRGTVDALCSAIDLVDGPLVVCNGDDIYGAHSFKILFDHLQNHDESASLGYILENVLPEVWSTNRWIFTVDADNYIQDIQEYLWIEKNNLSAVWLQSSNLCSMNIFWLHRSDVQALKDVLSQFKTTFSHDRRVECYLPVELSNLIKSGKISMKLYSTPDKRFGVTNPDDEEIVRQQIEEYEKLRNLEA